MKHPNHNPDGLTYSENCGPTSLAMSLDRLNLQPRGYAPGTGKQAMIDASRFAMFSDEAGRSLDAEKDGVETLPGGLPGPRNEAEHQTLTNLEDVERGAENSGATSYRLAHLEDVDLALQNGQPVMLAGNPYQPGAYGQRFGLDYDGGHFISVSAVAPDNNGYIINDPLLAEGAAKVSKAEIQSFLSANIFEDSLGLAFDRSNDFGAC